MQQGTKNVLEQAITAISTVAQRAEGHFLPYYDHFMPSLKFIIQSAITPEYRLLRGKTIECVSFIGLAVGSEKVRNTIVLNQNETYFCNGFNRNYLAKNLQSMYS